jgi:hypothetical protein
MPARRDANSAGADAGPQRLVQDFGRNAQRTRRGVQAIADALSTERSSPFSGQACPPCESPGGQARPLNAWQSWYGLVVDALTGQMLAALGHAAVIEPLANPTTQSRGFSPESLGPVAQELAARAAQYSAAWWLARSAEGRDLFKALYQDLFPRRVRHRLGEYYTPDWLAEHVLDQVGYHGQPEVRLLDPACGSGTFLVAAIRRLRKTLGKEPSALGTILRNVVGLDVQPLAAITSRANYLLALADLLPPAASQETPLAASPDIPVHVCDSILDGPGPAVIGEGFDYVVGNPPWIAWDNLPQDYRQATRPLWQQYGLFSLGAREARHGGGKKDLAMLMLYVAADRYLRAGGRLGMVVTQTVFQTRGAGDGFRRFRLGPHGPWLGVLRVDDLVAMRPFDAANWSSTLVLEKGRPTQYPVPYVKWSAAGRQEVCRASPITADRPGSSWLVVPVDGQSGLGVLAVRSAETACRQAALDARPAVNGQGLLFPLAGPVDRSDYAAHLGANSGGANGVYWLEVLGGAAGGVRVRNLAGRGKTAVEPVETVIEPRLLYPLLRWADVDCYRATPSAYLLLPQDAATRAGVDADWLRRELPWTHAYLRRFEPLLVRRAAYRRYQSEKPFYSMYNVGPYTLAPIKVIWRRMDRRIRAAVVEPVHDPWLGVRPVVPQETCVLVACGSADEAHYLCAVLNSSIVGSLVAAHSVAGSKGFGTPGILDVLPIRAFDPADPRHAALAACGRRAQQQAADVGHEIDSLLAELWGIGQGL